MLIQYGYRCRKKGARSGGKSRHKSKVLQKFRASSGGWLFTWTIRIFMWHKSSQCCARLSGRGSRRASLTSGHKGSCTNTGLSTLFMTWNGSFSLPVRVLYSPLMMELSWCGYLCLSMLLLVCLTSWYGVGGKPTAGPQIGLVLYHDHWEISMSTILSNYWNHSSKFLIISLGMCCCFLI